MLDGKINNNEEIDINARIKARILITYLLLVNLIIGIDFRRV